MAELTLKNVCKTFYKDGQPVEAVRSLNLHCRDGEFVALLGPSGCGKSTTLRMIAGLEEVTSGEIVIGERVVNRLHPRDRHIGLAFENYALYPPLTVYENIAFNLRAKKMRAADIQREVERIAKWLHIRDLMDKKPASLSGGQKQRVNIARAMIRRPNVLLLDEPLSHLDGKMRQKMRTEIKRLHHDFRSTTILVTHDQSEAMALADRIAVIHEGELQQFAPPLELFQRPANAFVAGFIGEPPMNLFTVSVGQGDGRPRFYIDGSDLSFAIPDSMQSVVQAGETYTFGIRPTDIGLVSANDTHTLSTRVTVFENLGEECRISIRLNGQMFNVVTGESVSFRQGDPIYLWFKPEKSHLFDDDTGNKIA